MGTFFQSFWRQPGISLVCAISPAAVLYAAFVSEAGTGTVKETQDSSLSVSTSVAVARRFTAVLCGVPGATAAADAARRTPRRALGVAAASGGRFCGVASAPVAFDGESDEEIDEVID